ncbi:hypothetical protein ACFV24_05840 [Nocardia fluminea]|uniref:hypothetical protein n=1 Tax=Nocardia fluminea TaxID=134984 RepID=UPI00364C8958
MRASPCDLREFEPEPVALACSTRVAMRATTAPLGTCVVTSLSNADKLIDYTAPRR